MIFLRPGRGDLQRCIESIASQSFCGQVNVFLSHTQAQLDSYGLEFFSQTIQHLLTNSSFRFDLSLRLVADDYQMARALQDLTSRDSSSCSSCSSSLTNSSSDFNLQWVLWIDGRDWMVDKSSLRNLQLAQQVGRG
eukprot:747607-Hanusia_phi.AAC.3